ncbi:MAG TPA: GlsB/YeaQ/YmgE family stress response membrane protein [Thermomicrobiaceae bacterium]|nr:GlsB/YeaQ/YmgE family stress response membrane protein [Thermomicrobiaceae bacterium]
MSIIGWVIIGLIAGWLASLILHHHESWWADIILGVIGALVGGFIYGLVTGRNFVAHFNVGTLIVAVIGAIVVEAIWGAIRAAA